MKRCYLCGKNGPKKDFIKLGFEIDKCPDCGLRSLNFKGNYDKFLTTYYQKGFFTGGKRFRAYADYEGDKPIHLRNLQGHLHGLLNVLSDPKFKINLLDIDLKFKIKNLKLSKPRLLDAGCAMGYFMELAQNANFDVYGIDVSDYAVDIAKKTFGDRVKLGQIENLDQLFNGKKVEPSSKNLDKVALASDSSDGGPKGLLRGVTSETGEKGQGSTFSKNRFDVVTLFDLLEHLQNPRKVLEKINQSLNDNGLLVVQTGNAGSRWAKLMGKNWHFFAPPQHFFFFTEENLKNLLRQTGFEVIKIDRNGKWVSLRYLFHMMRYVNKDGLGDLLYKLTHKNFLGRIPLLFAFGDNMTIYAQKTN